MQSSTSAKVIATLALLALLIAGVVRLSTSKTPPAEQAQPSHVARNDVVQRPDTYIPPVRASGHVQPAADDAVPTKLNPLTVSREKIEAYLKLHNRNAASLLAAFHASADDTNYLKEAAMNFPNDPHVQLTVLAHDLFPDDRRKWLDAFAAASPDNSLANYLSAQDYFKNGQPDAAIKELTEASARKQFSDFELENLQEAVDLYQYSGQNPSQAITGAMGAMTDDLMPLLADAKGVALGLLDAQNPYVNSGDTVSVENLSQMSLGLADRFADGDGGRFLIGHLVGIAIENISLRSLEQNTAYDFLGGETPAQRMDELKQEKAGFRELAQVIGGQPNFYDLTEAQQISYFDKMKTDGEISAIRWMQQLQHPTATQGGQ